MAYSRPHREAATAGTRLLGGLAGIGINLAVEPDPHADIEETLVAASELGLLDEDLRVLSLLTSWLGVHHAYVNVGRLERMLRGLPSSRVQAYWASIGRWLAKDRRYARLEVAHKGEPVDLLTSGNEFQLARRGEDPRFAGAVLRVPNGTLRDRPRDVLAPEDLVHRHRGYRNRVIMGPSWRALVWTLLEDNPHQTVSDLARGAGCAFATAWEVARDFRLVHPPITAPMEFAQAPPPGEF